MINSSEFFGFVISEDHVLCVVYISLLCVCFGCLTAELPAKLPNFPQFSSISTNFCS